MSESVVLCEGYHDREFWAGWLEHLGLTDPGLRPGRTERVPIFDPWKKKVAGGQFGFLSPTDHFVRIVPCHGDIRRIKETAARDWLDSAAKEQRQGAGESRLRRLVLSIDSDVNIDEPDIGKGFVLTDLCSWLWQFDRSAELVEGGEVLLFGGAMAVSLVRWEAEDSMRGVPSKQTLERLVCAAIVAAYPERAEPVHRWLESRPNAPEAGPKEFAWSHMAGWYAEFGSATFYRKLWNEPAVAVQLQSRLEACGVWQVAEELAK